MTVFPVLVLAGIGVLTLSATWVAAKRCCPASVDRRHIWTYAGPTGPSWDRKCEACGKED